jgi:predicted dithiol-disulfide oxidoreductase (DUF899 family)
MKIWHIAIRHDRPPARRDLLSKAKAVTRGMAALGRAAPRVDRHAGREGFRVRRSQRSGALIDLLEGRSRLVYDFMSRGSHSHYDFRALDAHARQH